MNDFRNIWMPHADRFYRAAYYLLESRQDAEDAVQELYLKLWASRSRLKEVKTPVAYGLSLLKNICIDRIRRREVRAHESLDAVMRLPKISPDDGLVAKDMLKRIMEEIDKLPDRQSEVMKLMVLDGLGYAEISQRTGLSQVHVRVLVSIARKSLKQKLRI